MRLAKYIASTGYCSRRKACRLIESGQVTVDGKQASHTLQVTENDPICVQGKRLTALPKRTYLLYNKPTGLDCVCNPLDDSSIIHHIPDMPRVFPVGRLDKDSHGLMLLTNDGALCQRILHPHYQHEKEYRVRVNQPLTTAFIEAMEKGMSYKNITTKPCKLHQSYIDEFHITLTQGMNRQIRRMCHALGYKVVELQRLRIMSLKLGQLSSNHYRNTTVEEKNQLLSYFDDLTFEV